MLDFISTWLRRKMKIFNFIAQFPSHITFGIFWRPSFARNHNKNSSTWNSLATPRKNVHQKSIVHAIKVGGDASKCGSFEISNSKWLFFRVLFLFACIYDSCIYFIPGMYLATESHQKSSSLSFRLIIILTMKCETKIRNKCCACFHWHSLRALLSYAKWK